MCDNVRRREEEGGGGRRREEEGGGGRRREEEGGGRRRGGEGAGCSYSPAPAETVVHHPVCRGRRKVKSVHTVSALIIKLFVGQYSSRRHCQHHVQLLLCT